MLFLLDERILQIMSKHVIIVLSLLLCCASLMAQTSADSLTLVSARWEERTVEKGVLTMHCEFPMLYGGLQDVYMLEIARKKHSFEVLDHNGRGFTSFKANNRGAVAAINGTYFDMGESERSVCFVARKGKVVEYTHDPLGQLSNGAVVMDGSDVDIIPWDVKMEHLLYPDSVGVSDAAVKNVMVAGPLLLQDGFMESFRDESHIMGKHPRSAIAVKGKHVFLVVVDGRDEERAIGVTIPELAHMLKVLGMEKALNLDGGGSSTLWARPKVQFYTDGTPVCPCTGILNVPSDGGHERAVSNSIVVVGR